MPVWPVYVAVVRARLRCPVVLLVITPTKSVARWCATPILIMSSEDPEELVGWSRRAAVVERAEDVFD